MFRRNPVQSFIRNLVRLVILVPLWLLLVWSDLDKFESMYIWIAVKSIFLLWFANVFAKMFFIIPQWQRIVLLRLGRSVGARGPGVIIVPPFIYSTARTIDIRITTYEVKATKTLTKDNIPIDVTAAVELEVEDPEKAAIEVQNYWKTTEWASMEALKSTIGKNDLRPLLSETDRIAAGAFLHHTQTRLDDFSSVFGRKILQVYRELGKYNIEAARGSRPVQCPL